MFDGEGQVAGFEGGVAEVVVDFGLGESVSEKGLVVLDCCWVLLLCVGLFGLQEKVLLGGSAEGYRYAEEEGFHMRVLSHRLSKCRVVLMRCLRDATLGVSGLY